MERITDEFTRNWIIENSIRIVSDYNDGVLTLRALHYQLVAIGMTNTIQHYKRVVGAMEQARWDGLISFEKFSDLDREMVGETKYQPTNVEDEFRSSANTIKYWLQTYDKNRWENQPFYIEVLIEKKALQGIFEPICRNFDIALGALKGFSSLTFLNDTAKRLKEAQEYGKQCKILYFGDYDPSGMMIPISMKNNLERFGIEDLEVERISLNEDQVIEWSLPAAPIKPGDSRSAKFTGLGQVELDAVPPRKLEDLCRDAINSNFDSHLYSDLLIQEDEEKIEYITKLKEFVQNIDFED